MNDIEVLEDINYINKILKDKLSADEYGEVVVRVAIIKAELKERQSDKERIKELEEMLKNRIKYTNELEKDLFENASNYVVPKSLIKEKIEELKKRKQDLLKLPSDCGRSIALEDCDEKIALYQELLGEEK